MAERDDEFNDAMLERKARLRRASVWLLSLVFFGVVIGLMIGRIVNPSEDAIAMPSRVLQVTPMVAQSRLSLSLLLDRPPHDLRRNVQDGAVSFVLARASLRSSFSGDVSGNERFSWLVRPVGSDVRVLLVPLAGHLQVIDTIEPNDPDGWRLTITAEPLR
ncbi:hypothetical protein [Pseudomonas matsuisoli]|uniref:Uncharacterized protein n=1 Tax=Pseudomonas matsuisoli TaxID=1515666 RepID=A0A917PKZ4_9PSED|nr:hypothetical protein [Pseudomonas matsuisoli]GGJ83459.1 hypothetical protein GCM10009304_06800 [Pseudomonas matsuisoli]